jgi:hypothetical protein
VGQSARGTSVAAGRPSDRAIYPRCGSAPRAIAGCYWAITHNGSKITAQPSTDNVVMDIIAARAESGRWLVLAAPSDATE